jgi:hypothetical protein
MPEVQGDLPVGTSDTDGAVGRADASADGDAFLRADAERLGYLTSPRGMARYLRDFGMLPPRYMDESLRGVEVTGLEIDRMETP